MSRAGRIIYRMKLARPFTACLALLLTAMPALAQQAQQIPNAPQNKRFGAVMLSLGLLVAIGVAGFMTPKRGHQD